MSYNNKLPPRVPKGSPEGGQFTNTAEKTADELKTDLQQKVNDNPLIVKSAAKQMLRDFVQRVQNGQAKAGEVCELGEITDRARQDIENLTKHKLNAKKHVIGADEIKHIEKGHGSNGISDHSMAQMEDYERIVDILSDYQSVDWVYKPNGEIETTRAYLDSNGKPSRLLKFKQELENGEQYVIEAVSDTKRGELHVISSYKNSANPKKS